MDSEYVSILDFSKRAGVTKQAVYQRIDRDLSNYCKIDGKRKYISLKALPLFGVKRSDKPFNQPNNQQIDLYLRMIDMLERQLEIKDKQLETKDRQIDALTMLVNQQQQLHAITEKPKEEPRAENPMPIRRVPKKRGIFPFRR